MQEKYPNAVIIVQHLYSGQKISWKEYEELFDECDGEIVIALGNVEDCINAYENDYPFYYGYPLQTYEEFNFLIQLDPYYIIPGAPLFFDLQNLVDKGASLRCFPNICTFSLFPKVEPCTGTWIRPEDMDYYSQFFDSCEFISRDIEQERAFFRIYKREKRFIGSLGLLIPDLSDYHADNDLINSEFIPVRTYCRQKCESGERICHICKDLLYLANPDNIRYLVEKN